MRRLARAVESWSRRVPRAAGPLNGRIGRAVKLMPVVLLAAGCGVLSTPSLVRNYYTIDYLPRWSPPAGSHRPYPYALQVGRFEVDRATNRENVVYRFSPHQLQYYDRERWAVRPDDMIRDMVFKHLDQAGLTTGLALEFSDRRPDFRLDGMVEALERYDAGDLFFSHLAMTLKLVKVDSGDQVWSYGFDQRRRVRSRDMVQTVQALADILQSNMDVAVTQLDSLFLAASEGKPLTPTPVVVATPRPQPAPQPQNSGVDESGFEIIKQK